jgi:hypothetical protein
LALEVALGQPLAKTGYEVFQAFIAVLSSYINILTHKLECCQADYRQKLEIF